MDLHDAEHHTALLALAGRVPDGWLTIAREVLADGDRERLTALRSAVAVEPVPRKPVRFSPAARVPLDRAVVVAVRSVPGISACWSVVREDTVRVYLVQTASGADLPAVAARLQAAVSGAAMVEVFGPDTALTAYYHEAALLAATLVWTAEPLAPVRVTKTFDGAGPEGPYFSPARELVVDPAERSALVDFLSCADIVLKTDAKLPDVLTGRPAVVPADLRSDGVWVWSEASRYYLERHSLSLDAGLVAHARLVRPWRRLSPLDHYRVRAALNPIDQKGPMWRAA